MSRILVKLMCILVLFSCRTRKHTEVEPSSQSLSNSTSVSFKAEITPVNFSYSQENHTLLRLELSDFNKPVDNVDIKYCTQDGNCQSKKMSYPLAYLHLPKAGNYSFIFKASSFQTPAQTIQVSDASEKLSALTFKIFDLRESLLSKMSQCKSSTAPNKNFALMKDAELLSFLDLGFAQVSALPETEREEMLLYFLIQPYLLQELGAASAEAKKRSLNFEASIPGTLLPLRSINLSSLEQAELGLVESNKSLVTYYPQSHFFDLYDKAAHFLYYLSPETVSQSLVSTDWDTTFKDLMQKITNDKETNQKFRKLLDDPYFSTLKKEVDINVDFSMDERSSLSKWFLGGGDNQKFPIIVATVIRYANLYRTSFDSQLKILSTLNDRIANLPKGGKLVLFSEGRKFDPIEITQKLPIKDQAIEDLGQNYTSEIKDEGLAEQKYDMERRQDIANDLPTLQKTLLSKNLESISFDEARRITRYGADNIIALFDHEKIILLGVESERAYSLSGRAVEAPQELYGILDESIKEEVKNIFVETAREKEALVIMEAVIAATHERVTGLEYALVYGRSHTFSANSKSIHLELAPGFQTRNKIYNVRQKIRPFEIKDARANLKQIGAPPERDVFQQIEEEKRQTLEYEKLVKNKNAERMTQIKKCAAIAIVGCITLTLGGGLFLNDEICAQGDNVENLEKKLIQASSELFIK